MNQDGGTDFKEESKVSGSKTLGAMPRDVNTDFKRRANSLALTSSDVLASTFGTMLTSIGILEEKEGEGSKEQVLANAAGFLFEDNANYDWSNNLIQSNFDEGFYSDPSNPPTKGCNRLYIRFLVRRFVYHILFRLLTLTLIIVDFGLLIAGAIITNKDGLDPREKPINIADMVISSYFMVEMGLRMYAVTPKVLLSRNNWFNWLDLVLVVSFFIMAIINLKLVYDAESSDAITISQILVVLRVLRFVRLIRVVRIYTEHHQLKRGMRQLVSKNKRRYREDGADLDLTYITPNIIAMSFPSSGLRAWYRNNIIDVVRFLDKKHKDNYRVYNLCSERTYPKEIFHGQVFHVPISDHNVPSVNQMIEFVKDVTEYLNQDLNHVVAIHCKGGKGRTGTMICILLIKLGLINNAEHSLDYFGKRRTDINVSSQFQGVETASQIRYVTYFEQLLSQTSIQEMKNPPIVHVTMQEIVVNGLSTIGAGDGSDMSFIIDVRAENQLFTKEIFKGNIVLDNVRTPAGQPKGMTQCPANYSTNKDQLIIHLKQFEITVKEDVRIRFFSSCSDVPKGYENCAFYFWFHTSFLDNNVHSVYENGCFRLKIQREELDNPHKPKRWDVYGKDFSVEVRMEVSK